MIDLSLKQIYSLAPPRTKTLPLNNKKKIKKEKTLPLNSNTQIPVSAAFLYSLRFLFNLTILLYYTSGHHAALHTVI
jgi:hypothetical protein